MGKVPLVSVPYGELADSIYGGSGKSARASNFAVFDVHSEVFEVGVSGGEVHFEHFEVDREVFEVDLEPREVHRETFEVELETPEVHLEMFEVELVCDELIQRGASSTTRASTSS